MSQLQANSSLKPPRTKRKGNKNHFMYTRILHLVIPAALISNRVSGGSLYISFKNFFTSSDVFLVPATHTPRQFLYFLFRHYDSLVIYVFSIHAVL